MSSGLTLQRFEDLAAFEGVMGPWLGGEEAQNSLFIGLMTSLQKRPPQAAMFMAMVLRGDKIILGAFFTGHLLLLTPGDREAVPLVVEEFKREGWKMPGVVGPVDLAEAFAVEWGAEIASVMEQRIYVLEAVVPPPPAPGQMRAATIEDVGLVLDWFEQFHEHAMPMAPFDREGARKNLHAKIESQYLYLWERDGEPVSCASYTRPTRNGISVGSVFTPPEYRRQGYATALVAGVSQAALDLGKQFTVLYTDLANPTSNSIYMKIGYRPIADCRNYWFR